MTYVAAVGAWAVPTVRTYAYIRGTILWWVHVMPVVASSSRCVERTRYACTCVPEESCPIEDMYVYDERVAAVLSYACRDDGVGRGVEKMWQNRFLTKA